MPSQHSQPSRLPAIQADLGRQTQLPTRAAGPGLVHLEQGERCDVLRVANDGKIRLGRCKRRTITQARLADQEARRGGFRGRWLMVTPTYRDSADWQPNHIRDYVHRMRAWFRRQGHRCRYQWVMELTKRGRPHYHLLVWVPRHLMLPHADRRGWWAHGLTRTEVARNPVGYLAKYASKGGDLCDQDGNPYRFPKGARICGGGGLELPSRIELRWWMTPRWFRDQVQQPVDLRRIAGGFVVVDTGEVYESPWRFAGCSSGWKELLFVRKETFP